MSSTVFGSAPRAVVVGLDGSDSALNALRFAAAEARYRGGGLTLAHVTPAYTPVGPALPMVADQAIRDYAERVLEQGGREARAVAPDVPVDTVLFKGGRVSGLVECARSAAVLVVGASERGTLERVWTGTTVTGVAARAHCPVVVVPAGWASGEPRGRVLVGFKSPEHCAEAFTHAFELAARDGAEVLVVHAWRLISGYDDIVTNRAAEEEWRDREAAVIEPLLAEQKARYPQVPVRVEVVHDQPAHALLERGRSADRLVLVRPVHGGFVHHLGAVARAVLREATCPVEVVPPVHQVVRGRHVAPAGSSEVLESGPSASEVVGQ